MKLRYIYLKKYSFEFWIQDGDQYHRYIVNRNLHNKQMINNYFYLNKNIININVIP